MHRICSFILVALLLTACEFKISFDKEYEPEMACLQNGATMSYCGNPGPNLPSEPGAEVLAGDWQLIDPPNIESCKGETLSLSMPLHNANNGIFRLFNPCAGIKREGYYSVYGGRIITFKIYLPYPNPLQETPAVYECRYDIDKDKLSLECDGFSPRKYQRVVRIDKPIPKPYPPDLPSYYFTQCDGANWSFDVYLIPSTSPIGSYKIVIMPVSIDTPGDIASVTIANDLQNGYKHLVSRVVLYPNKQIDAGVVSFAQLKEYPILAITSYEAGANFFQQTPVKSTFCELPLPEGDVHILRQ